MREKLIEFVKEAEEYATEICVFHDSCEACLGRKYGHRCRDYLVADRLIANGVTIQSDTIEILSKQLSALAVRMLGHDKQFEDKMAGYSPSAFCAGFEYAIQLAKGLLTQLPEPPKGE